MNNWLTSIWIDISMIIKIIVVIIAVVAVVILAKIIAAAVGSAIGKMKFIKQLFKKVDVKLDMQLIAKIVSKTLYFILIISAIIGWLTYLGVLDQSSLGNFVDSYLLKFLNALGLGVLAWFLAVLARSGVSKALKTAELDKKIGNDLKSEKSVSVTQSLSSLAYWAVIFFFLPQILSKLWQETLLSPITDIINDITDFIPRLLSAAVIIGLAYFIGKFVSKLISEILSWFGFDKVLKAVGLKKVESQTTPSSLVGKLVFVYIVLFAALEAADKIGFSSLSGIINQFIAFASNILVGVVIFGIGMYLANLASKAIKTTTDSKFLPKIAKGAIIVLTAFMGLQQMGLGWAIINQAFTLLLGAAAVAFALAVGLGSKEVAGEEVKKFLENMKK